MLPTRMPVGLDNAGNLPRYAIYPLQSTNSWGPMARGVSTWVSAIRPPSELTGIDLERLLPPYVVLDDHWVGEWVGERTAELRAG